MPGQVLARFLRGCRAVWERITAPPRTDCARCNELRRTDRHAQCAECWGEHNAW